MSPDAKDRGGARENADFPESAKTDERAGLGFVVGAPISQEIDALTVAATIAAGRQDMPELEAALQALTKLGVRRLERNGEPVRGLLRAAAQSGPAKAVSLLLDWQDPDERDAMGNTALMLAARRGALEAVKLLAPKSNCEARNHQGYTAAHLAACEDQIKVLEFFVGLGPLPVSATTLDTVLHAAADRSSLNCARFLIEGGHCDPKAKNVFGNAALMLALDNDCLEMARLVSPVSNPPVARTVGSRVEAVSMAYAAAAAGSPECLAFFMQEFDWANPVEGRAIWETGFGVGGRVEERARCLALLQAAAPLDIGREAIQRCGESNLPALFARVEAFDLAQSLSEASGGAVTPEIAQSRAEDKSRQTKKERRL